MRQLNPTRPTEITGFHMENELLRYEVRHLKARLSAATGEFPPGAEEISAAREAARSLQTEPDLDLDILTRNQQAYDDIVWLVRRLDASVVGPVLRRWQGFRMLRSRYVAGEGS